MPEEVLTIEQLSAEQMVSFIANLIEHDFSRLVQILYRLDVSEDKLKQVLIENPTGDAAEMIANLIRERIAMRDRTKNMFRQQGEIADDEKW